jgi:hypothetical protein
MRGTWAEAGKAKESMTSRTTERMGLDFTALFNYPIGIQFFGLALIHALSRLIQINSKVFINI